MSKNTKLNQDRYNKLELHEQIILRPDTYIGSITEDKVDYWIYNPEINKMVFKKNCTIVPGLYKIFDEIIVNAIDHTIRDITCTEIKITIDKKTGRITCYNNGDNGVPVDKHSSFKTWIPEMIFAHLLTSENYDDSKIRYVGGKNGFGAKLANIFSTNFDIEVFDSKNSKHYIQNCSNNMYKIDEPEIKVNKKLKHSFLKLSYIADFKKFKIKEYNDDMINLFYKRVYDIAACCANNPLSNNVKVYLNDELINFKSFKDYVTMFFDDSNPIKIYSESPNDNWEVCAVFDPNGFKQISFVNGIWTIEGGSHVDHVLKKFTSYIIDATKDKNVKVTKQSIKDNITLFIRSLIDKPAFNSQIKEKLTSKLENFDTKCNLSEDFLKKFSKSGIIEEVLSFARFKEHSSLKKISGVKVKHINIPKLDDAHFAGTINAKKCRLILTEGDSAKTFAIAGLMEIKKDYFGVFPLKGKLLNVRELSPTKIQNNEEIKNIIDIIGLKFDKKYEDIKDISTLRYGGIVIIADQDLDGSHIKGLLINFIHYFWPSLLINSEFEFIQTLPTPIVKVWKKSDKKKINEIPFYTMSEFNNWDEEQTKKGTRLQYETKYYKGLGTFKDAEALKCFSDYYDRIITYIWETEAKDEEDYVNTPIKKKGKKTVTDNIDSSYKAITLAFSKENADLRKNWLENYDKDNILENSDQKISYYDFIHKDLKHFSFYDNTRSIPSICDMFKPSTRKIMYSAFLNKEMLHKEIKVAQFAGIVSQKSAYHHGEKSLEGAIIGLAQNFVGSNNINLLMPNGQFGSRLLMGKDHASSRYIMTQISSITPYIYRAEDECILKYQYDGKLRIEPDNYIPILPMILINGGEGIGTGFSTKILPYNISDIITNIKNLINKKKLIEMVPWYRNFKGKIVKTDAVTYKILGSMEIDNSKPNTIFINELPVGTATTPYMDYIKSILIACEEKEKEKKKGNGNEKHDNSDLIMEDIIENNGPNEIDIKIRFANNISGQSQKDLLLTKLKLVSTVKTSNMHLHSTEGRLKKYETVNDILIEFFNYRLKKYAERKEKYLRELKYYLDITKWKIKFIEMYLNKEIILYKKTKIQVYEQLEKFKFPKFYADHKKNYSDEIVLDDEDDEENKDNTEIDSKVKKNIPTYSYLNMNIFVLTIDEMEKLKKTLDEREAEYEKYKNTPIEDIWLSEVEELEKKYKIWLEEESEIESASSKNKNGTKVRGKGKRK